MSSRLYRVLKPTAELFSFDVDGARLYGDTGIRSIAIHRGQTPAAGVAPSTCEIATVAFASVRTGKSCSVHLTDHGASIMAGLTGANPATIAQRFNGRIGRQTVDDTGKRQLTTFSAASWTAQLPGNSTPQSTVAGENIGVVIGRIMAPASLGLPEPVRMAPAEQYGTVWTPAAGKYSDLIGKYTDDLGVIVRDTRAGGSQILTHKFRRDRAAANMAAAVPLTRSQAISPAKWEQGNEVQPRNYKVSYTNASNTTTTATYGDPGNPAVEVVDVDMKHAKFATDTSQPDSEGFARRSRDWVSSYRIPSVTVDLLHLVSSPAPIHQRQAAWLLGMEAGDAVYLSGDWYTQLRGIQYAEAITERITPTAWTIEFSLTPAHAAVGEISPAVPARTWESLTGTWDAEPRTWNES